MYSYDLKIRVINYYLEVKSCRKTADTFSIGKSTVSRWIIDHNNDNIRKKYIREKKQIDSNIINTINRIISKKPFIIVKNIKKTINKLFNTTYSIDFFYKLLRRLNYSFKKVYLRKYSNKATLKKLIEQKNNFLNFINSLNINNVICLDETYFRFNNKPNYGWSKKGTKIYKHEKDNQIKYSLIMAINNKQILAHSYHKSNINIKLFGDFLKNKLLNKIKNKYILMDIVSFHKNKEILKIITDSGNIPLFIPPYTPELNPIEEVFSKIKNYVKRHNCRTIDNYIKNGIKTITTNNLCNYYKHSYEKN